MGRLAAFLYGTVAYVTFFLTFLYAVGFVGNIAVPKSIDSGAGGFSLAALVIDAILLGLFAIQHSVMARPWFKRAWTRIVPPAAERSTYVLFSCMAMFAMFWLWRPIGGVVWDVQDPVWRGVINAAYGAG